MCEGGGSLADLSPGWAPLSRGSENTPALVSELPPRSASGDGAPLGARARYGLAAGSAPNDVRRPLGFSLRLN